MGTPSSTQSSYRCGHPSADQRKSKVGNGNDSKVGMRGREGGVIVSSRLGAAGHVFA